MGSMNSIALSTIAGLLLRAGLGWLGISTEKAGRDTQSTSSRTSLGHVTPGPLHLRRACEHLPFLPTITRSPFRNMVPSANSLPLGKYQHPPTHTRFPPCSSPTPHNHCFFSGSGSPPVQNVRPPEGGLCLTGDTA